MHAFKPSLYRKKNIKVQGKNAERGQIELIENKGNFVIQNHYFRRQTFLNNKPLTLHRYLFISLYQTWIPWMKKMHSSRHQFNTKVCLLFKWILWYDETISLSDSIRGPRRVTIYLIRSDPVIVRHGSFSNQSCSALLAWRGNPLVNPMLETFEWK